MLVLLMPHSAFERMFCYSRPGPSRRRYGDCSVSRWNSGDLSRPIVLEGLRQQSLFTLGYDFSGFHPGASTAPGDLSPTLLEKTKFPVPASESTLELLSVCIVLRRTDPVQLKSLA